MQIASQTVSAGKLVVTNVFNSYRTSGEKPGWQVADNPHRLHCNGIRGGNDVTKKILFGPDVSMEEGRRQKVDQLLVEHLKVEHPIVLDTRAKEWSLVSAQRERGKELGSGISVLCVAGSPLDSKYRFWTKGAVRVHLINQGQQSIDGGPYEPYCTAMIELTNPSCDFMVIETVKKDGGSCFLVCYAQDWMPVFQQAQYESWCRGSNFNGKIQPYQPSL